MTIIDVINYLTVLVLIGFLVVMVYFVFLLHRANRVISRLEHLSETFRSFVGDIVPAIINIGTIATAMESVIRALHNSDHKVVKTQIKKSK